MLVDIRADFQRRLHLLFTQCLFTQNIPGWSRAPHRGRYQGISPGMPLGIVDLRQFSSVLFYLHSVICRRQGYQCDRGAF